MPKKRARIGRRSPAIGFLENRQRERRSTGQEGHGRAVSGALAIGFEYAQYTTALRHLARYQFECLRGAELTGTVPTFLGNNLLNLWSRLDYKQLSAKDLETKQMLMDSAHEMKRASVRTETAAAAMVLLLARLFRHSGAAGDWAGTELQGRGEELPEDVRLRLATH